MYRTHIGFLSQCRKTSESHSAVQEYLSFQYRVYTGRGGIILSSRKEVTDEVRHKRSCRERFGINHDQGLTHQFTTISVENKYSVLSFLSTYNDSSKLTSCEMREN